MISVLASADRAVVWFCKYVTICLVLALFLLLGLAIIARVVPVMTIEGYDEIVELLFIWITMLTTVALWREGTLYRVAVIENLLPRAGQRVLEILINCSMLAFALMLVVYGFQFVVGSGEITPFLGLNRAYWYSALPIGGAFMALYSLVWLRRIVLGDGSLEKTTTLVS